MRKGNGERMTSMQSKKKYKRLNRQRKPEVPSSFNAKLFVSLGLLLVVLLMKKYDLAIGDFNVDSLYKVVYYNEDLNALKEKIFFFNSSANDTKDTLQNIPSEDLNNVDNLEENLNTNTESQTTDQLEPSTNEDSNP